MKLFLPEFVKTMIIFFIMLLAIITISSLQLIYFSIQYFPDLIMENIFFFFNGFFIITIFIIAALYPYTDDIVIYISVVLAVISAFILSISIYYHAESLPFIAYMILFMGIILHKKNYFKI